MDILFRTEEFVFSYRVAGICIQDEKILLQKPVNDTAFAFPGGHVAFGETNAQALKREFQEETGAEISVGALKWVGELFFPWGSKPCHQICLYYLAEVQSGSIPLEGVFSGKEQLEGKTSDLEFHWVPLSKLNAIEVYPTNAAELIKQMDHGIQHFIYRE